VEVCQSTAYKICLNGRRGARMNFFLLTLFSRKSNCYLLQGESEGRTRSKSINRTQ